MFHNPLFVQSLGFAGLACTLTMFQLNDRKKMLMLGMASASFYAVHLLLLGAVTGVAINMINIGRGVAFRRLNHETRPVAIKYFFLSLYAVADLLTWHGWISLLPLLGAVAGTIALWEMCPQRIRSIMLTASPCWFVYNMSVGSYPGMIAEIFNSSSNVTAIYRHGAKDRIAALSSRLSQAMASGRSTALRG